jgi:hypothetical protein
MVYSLLLDSDGAVIDTDLSRGTVGVVDIGHHTIDIAIIDALRPVNKSLATWNLGTTKPLQTLAAQLGSLHDCELSLAAADQAVRLGGLHIAGAWHDLPDAWIAPFSEAGETIAARLTEAWGSGAHLDAILLGGGGAELPALTETIQQRFAHARIIEQPQMAIARGYARLARRLHLRGEG